MMPVRTKCPQEGTLRAYIDDELSTAERAAVEAHLQACQACPTQLAALRTGAESVYGALGRTPLPDTSTRAAWRRFEVRRQAAVDASASWRLHKMWYALRYGHWRPALAGAVLVAVLVV